MTCSNNYGVQIGTLWGESIFWGFYVALYGAAMFIIATQCRDKRLMIILSLNFALSTARMGADFAVMLLTPNYTCNTNCSGAQSNCHTCGGETMSTVHQAEVVNLVSLLTTTLLTTNQLIADAFLIWRCYAIWGFSYYPIVLPILFLLGTTACGYAQLYPWVQDYLLRLHAPISELVPPRKWFFYGDLNETLETSNMSFALATNVVVTTLIVVRIMYMTSAIDKEFMRKKRIYSSAMAILIESGASIALAYVVFIPVSYYSWSVTNVVDAILGQIIGIAPTLVILRLGLNKLTDQTYLDFAVANANTAPASRNPEASEVEPMTFAPRSILSPDEGGKSSACSGVQRVDFQSRISTQIQTVSIRST